MAGFDKCEYQVAGFTYADLRRGNYDGVEHLRDMDIDGVHASVFHPGFSPSFYSHPDSELFGTQLDFSWIPFWMQTLDHH